MGIPFQFHFLCVHDAMLSLAIKLLLYASLNNTVIAVFLID